MQLMLKKYLTIKQKNALIVPHLTIKLRIFAQYISNFS
jgi:hypothetical protein